MLFFWRYSAGPIGTYPVILYITKYVRYAVKNVTKRVSNARNHNQSVVKYFLIALSKVKPITGDRVSAIELVRILFVARFIL